VGDEHSEIVTYLGATARHHISTSYVEQEGPHDSAGNSPLHAVDERILAVDNKCRSRVNETTKRKL
jgi:hypothetical protein